MSSNMMVTHGKGVSGSTNPSKQPGYTGCFICGDKAHDYRSCPKRGSSSSGSQGSVGKGRPINFVSSEPLDSIMMVTNVSDEMVIPSVGPQDLHRMILTASTGSSSDPHRLGYAVLDTGATETVGSLQAIDYIVQKRAQMYGEEAIGVDPKRTKRFKFGNAEERVAESYLLLPQTVNGCPTSLGVYTLDVPNVPLLIGIKTMNKLGAVINVAEQTLVFTKVFPGTVIPLLRGQNGHLLLDLCQDWSQGFKQPHVSSSMTNPVFHQDTPCDREGKQVCPRADQEPMTDDMSHFTHNIHVVDTKSDHSMSIIEQFENPLHVAMSFPAQDRELHFPDPSSDSLVRNGPLQGDLGGHSTQTEHRDCNSDGRRDPQCEEEDRPEPFRPAKGGMDRSKRSEGDQGDLWWPACHSGLRQGLEERIQPSRTMVGMCAMPSSVDVSAGCGGSCGVSQCRPSGIGRPFTHREDGAQRHPRPKDFGHKGSWLCSSRNFCSEAFGAHSCPEGEGDESEVKAKGSSEGHHSNDPKEPSCGRGDRGGEDIRIFAVNNHEARESQDTGGAGSGVGPRGRQELGDHFSVKADLPSYVEDDGLEHPEDAAIVPSHVCDRYKHVTEKRFARAWQWPVLSWARHTGQFLPTRVICWRFVVGRTVV